MAAIEKCGAVSPSGQYVCDLPHGHAGDHHHTLPEVTKAGHTFPAGAFGVEWRQR